MDSDAEAARARVPGFIRWVMEAENPTWIHVAAMALLAITAIAASPFVVLVWLVWLSSKLIIEFLLLLPQWLRYGPPRLQQFWGILRGEIAAEDGLTGWFYAMAIVRSGVVTGVRVFIMITIVAAMTLAYVNREKFGSGGSHPPQDCGPHDCADLYYDPRR